MVWSLVVAAGLNPVLALVPVGFAVLTMTTTDVAIAQKDAPAEVTIKAVWEWLLEER